MSASGSRFHPRALGSRARFPAIPPCRSAGPCGSASFTSRKPSAMWRSVRLPVTYARMRSRVAPPIRSYTGRPVMCPITSQSAMSIRADYFKGDAASPIHRRCAVELVPNQFDWKGLLPTSRRREVSIDDLLRHSAPPSADVSEPRMAVVRLRSSTTAAVISPNQRRASFAVFGDSDDIGLAISESVSHESAIGAV